MSVCKFVCWSVILLNFQKKLTPRKFSKNLKKFKNPDFSKKIQTFPNLQYFSKNAKCSKRQKIPKNQNLFQKSKIFNKKIKKSKFFHNINFFKISLNFPKVQSFSGGSGTGLDPWTTRLLEHRWAVLKRWQDLLIWFKSKCNCFLSQFAEICSPQLNIFTFLLWFCQESMNEYIHQSASLGSMWPYQSSAAILQSMILVVHYIALQQI